MTNITEARKALIALRNKHGAASPIGSRCSTAVEILQNLERPGFALQAASLRSSLAATLREIHKLQAGATGKVQERREVA